MFFDQTSQNIDFFWSKNIKILTFLDQKSQNIDLFGQKNKILTFFCENKIRILTFFTKKMIFQPGLFHRRKVHKNAVFWSPDIPTCDKFWSDTWGSRTEPLYIRGLRPTSGPTLAFNKPLRGQTARFWYPRYPRDLTRAAQPEMPTSTFWLGV